MERHPLSARFHELLTEAGELHDQKQLDYGADADPFANVRATKDWGMPSWVGAMVRATDKVKRLQTFARKGQLANESVVDAFMDLAVYALIGRCLYEEEADHSGSPDEIEPKVTYAPFVVGRSFTCGGLDPNCTTQCGRCRVEFGA